MDEPDFRGETWAIPLPRKVNAHINCLCGKKKTRMSHLIDWIYEIEDRRVSALSAVALGVDAPDMIHMAM